MMVVDDDADLDAFLARTHPVNRAYEATSDNDEPPAALDAAILAAAHGALTDSAGNADGSPKENAPRDIARGGAPGRSDNATGRPDDAKTSNVTALPSQQKRRARGPFSGPWSLGPIPVSVAAVVVLSVSVVATMDFGSQPLTPRYTTLDREAPTAPPAAASAPGIGAGTARQQELAKPAVPTDQAPVTALQRALEPRNLPEIANRAKSGVDGRPSVIEHGTSGIQEDDSNAVNARRVPARADSPASYSVTGIAAGDTSAGDARASGTAASNAASGARAPSVLRSVASPPTLKEKSHAPTQSAPATVAKQAKPRPQALTRDASPVVPAEVPSPVLASPSPKKQREPRRSASVASEVAVDEAAERLVTPGFRAKSDVRAPSSTRLETTTTVRPDRPSVTPAPMASVADKRKAEETTTLQEGSMQGATRRAESRARGSTDASADDQSLLSRVPSSSTPSPSAPTSPAGAVGSSGYRFGESRSGESRSGESRSGESRSGESRSGESRSGESRSGESRFGVRQLQGARSSGSLIAEGQTKALDFERRVRQIRNLLKKRDVEGARRATLSLRKTFPDRTLPKDIAQLIDTDGQPAPQQAAPGADTRQ